VRFDIIIIGKFFHSKSFAMIEINGSPRVQDQVATHFNQAPIIFAAWPKMWSCIVMMKDDSFAIR